MILEVAVLSITPSRKSEFEDAYTEARRIISSMPGFKSVQLQRSVETPGRYLLLVGWGSVDDHMLGFRQSPEFQRWRALLGPFYASAPTVEHYEDTGL